MWPFVYTRPKKIAGVIVSTPRTYNPPPKIPSSAFSKLQYHKCRTRYTSRVISHEGVYMLVTRRINTYEPPFQKSWLLNRSSIPLPPHLSLHPADLIILTLANVEHRGDAEDDMRYSEDIRALRPSWLMTMIAIIGDDLPNRFGTNFSALIKSGLFLHNFSALLLCPIINYLRKARARMIAFFFFFLFHFAWLQFPEFRMQLHCHATPFSNKFFIYEPSKRRRIDLINDDIKTFSFIKKR